MTATSTTGRLIAEVTAAVARVETAEARVVEARAVYEAVLADRDAAVLELARAEATFDHWSRGRLT